MHRVSPQVTPVDDSLVKALLCADAFDHRVDSIDLIETHISWVVLAGDFAYKIKKPLVLDFLDFGDLDKRKFCCEEEIRLNRPWAPDIYVDVVPITQQGNQPRFGGDGEALEYAVKMRRFDQALLLDEQLAAGLLTVADMKELGRNIAERHAAATIPDASERDRLVKQAKHFFWENFDHFEGVLDKDDIAFLHDWTARELEQLDHKLGQRFDDGFVRDCHGDLHLGNLVRLPGGITTFDCIEFNPDLRNTDVFADIGFLAMDLVRKGRHDLAAHFLNRYLECSGDYDGVKLLDLYFIYRCLVRAKVAAIRSRERDSNADREADIGEAQAYADMARRQATKGPRALIVMFGLSGSGKTWLAERLMAALPAIRVRSDIERKRLFDLPEAANSGSPVGAGIYTEDGNAATYEQLFEHARRLLMADHHVILDGAFLTAKQRASARGIAAEAGCESVLVHADAPQDILEARIRQRARSRSEVSEANLNVLGHQLATAEPPSADEYPIVVDTSVDIDIETLVSSIRERVRG